MTTPISMRLPESMEKKVRDIARLERRSVPETVRLLTEEAIKIREFPSITFVDGPSGRRATFLAGPDVWQVLEPYVIWEGDWDALRTSYPFLPEATLREAVRYYEAYPDEIDVRVRLNSGDLG